jgi:hypothetical protein
MAPRIELYAFRYCDPCNGKWVRARYVVTLEEIARRYSEWEIVGPAEVRDVDTDARYFTPHKSASDAALRRYNERRPSCSLRSMRMRRSCWRFSCGDTLPTARGAAVTRQ